MKNPKFDYIAGTGGVGKGILFLLEGEHALGKNESRLANLTDFQDFCKLHVILHYTTKLTQKTIQVYPISRVGEDETGHELRKLMENVGMDTSYMLTDPNQKTMYAVCFQYSNGEGGNITTANSACSQVCEKDIDHFFESRKVGEKGLLLAVPEVPLNARRYLLHKGRQHNCYNVASLLSNEAKEFVEFNYFADIDLLAINQDEAQAILLADNIPFNEANMATVCGEYLNKTNPHMAVLITLGSRGSQSFIDGNAELIAPFGGEPVSTAGAGDCFLGVILACIAWGIPLQGAIHSSSINCATKLASLAVGIKITCKDTIHFGIDKASIISYARQSGLSIHPTIEQAMQL